MVKHPDMGPEEIKKLTGGVQKAQGRIGKWPLLVLWIDFITIDLIKLIDIDNINVEIDCDHQLCVCEFQITNAFWFISLTVCKMHTFTK